MLVTCRGWRLWGCGRLVTGHLPPFPSPSHPSDNGSKYLPSSSLTRCPSVARGWVEDIGHGPAILGSHFTRMDPPETSLTVTEPARGSCGPLLIWWWQGWCLQTRDHTWWASQCSCSSPPSPASPSACPWRPPPSSTSLSRATSWRGPRRCWPATTATTPSPTAWGGTKTARSSTASWRTRLSRGQSTPPSDSLLTSRGQAPGQWPSPMSPAWPRAGSGARSVARLRCSLLTPSTLTSVWSRPQPPGPWSRGRGRATTWGTPCLSPAHSRGRDRQLTSPGTSTISKWVSYVFSLFM